MRVQFSERTTRRLRVGAVAASLLVVAVVTGRVLLASATATTSATSTTPPHAASATASAKTGNEGHDAPGASRSSSAEGLPDTGHGVAAKNASPGALAGATAGQSEPATPVQPVGPDIVRTASVNLRVDKSAIGAQMSKIAELASSNGGYVNSSSMSGGTASSSPVEGQVVIRVASVDFTGVLSDLSGIGRITTQQVSGQDVTGQVAENAATLTVLQQEVDLLQSKLSQTNDISTFLQIEGQLDPVQQQLQQLASQQAVLEGSATLATVTVNLAAPGAPVPGPSPKARTNAARVAWRYLSHNSLAVLDGLAVAGGWALPVIVLAGFAWLVVTRLLRRKRPGVSAA